MTPSDMAIDFASRREKEKWGEATEHRELMLLIERARAIATESKDWAVVNEAPSKPRCFIKGWKPTGSDDNPEAKLSYSLCINEAWLHLEAYQVTKSGDGQLKLLDPANSADLDKIHDALGADGEFSTMLYNGKHYVVLGFPYEV